MRVRLYEMGDGAVGFVFRCDEFPALLGVDEANGRLSSGAAPRQPICRLDDIGGQLVFRCVDAERPPLVNDAPMMTGPLLPGDQLLVEGRRYIVSYEQTAEPPLPEARFRLSEQTR